MDDFLPFDTSRNPCCSYSTSRELWVSLIEKAYLKVHGGYGFPGTNSGVVLLALAGWMPESFDNSVLRVNARDKADAWQRISEGLSTGDCLVTVSTGEASDTLKEVGLAETHAYAVLEARQVGDIRLMLLKNPWSTSQTRWRGPFSAVTGECWTPRMREALQYDVEAARVRDYGKFWIPWDDVLRLFDRVSVSWNPAGPKLGMVHHGVCYGVLPKRDLPSVYPDDVAFGDGPQHRLRIAAGTAPRALWLKLSPFFAKAGFGGGDGFDSAEVSDDAATDGARLTLYIFKSGDSGLGTRVFRFKSRPDRLTPRTWFRRNTEYLKLTVGADVQDLTLVVGQGEFTKKVVYCIDVLCESEVVVAPVLERLVKVSEANGAWVSEVEPGARRTSSLLFYGPQYSLVLSECCDVLVSLFTCARKSETGAVMEEEPHSVLLRLLEWGEEADHDKHGRILKYSNEVSSCPSFTSCSSSLHVPSIKPGRYMIVPATWDGNAMGTFTLSVFTSGPRVVLTTLQGLAGTGLTYRSLVSGTWSRVDGTAVGCRNFGKYDRNPQFDFRIERETDIAVRIQTEPKHRCNLSIYSADGRASAVLSSHPMANSGVYVETAAISRTRLGPGMYTIVPSTFDPEEAVFKITVHSSLPLPVSSFIRRT